MVKNLPAMWETWVQSPGWEDPLEKGKATYSIMDCIVHCQALLQGDLSDPGIEPRSLMSPYIGRLVLYH